MTPRHKDIFYMKSDISPNLFNWLTPLAYQARFRLVRH